MERPMRRLVVVGGGIAGLSAAYYASQKFMRSAVITVVEQADYWGGKIVTERVDGYVIEGGPDTFLATKPWAVQLCQELGMASRLRGTNPQQKNTYILRHNRLYPLPGGLSMMIPTQFGEVLRTGLISWPGKLRMGLEYLLPPAAANGDESIGDFVTRRLGREAYEGLIEPLMSGIYAGDGDRLSVSATFPYLRELEQRYGGLIKGALAERSRWPARPGQHSSKGQFQAAGQAEQNGAERSGPQSIFLTPEDGLAEIVESLVEKLQDEEVGLLLGKAVVRIDKLPTGYRLLLADDQILEAEAVILATPAYVSAALLSEIHPDLSGELQTIDYISTATVSLAFREKDLARPLDGYGYVIPRREGRKALACTWTSTKFPHRAPQGKALVRVFIGRAGQEKSIDWDEASLLAIARAEVSETLGITADPILARVFIWEKAMPQYDVGHLARLQRITAALRDLPGLALAGNGYQGIGIPDCIHSGEQAARQVAAAINEVTS
jgi:oxygen-dependent protoporphyrinogen oxidase